VPVGAEGARDLVAIHAGQSDVAEHDLGRERPGLLETVRTVKATATSLPVELERCFRLSAESDVVSITRMRRSPLAASRGRRGAIRSRSPEANRELAPGPAHRSSRGPRPRGARRAPYERQPEAQAAGAPVRGCDRLGERLEEVLHDSAGCPCPCPARE